MNILLVSHMNINSPTGVTTYYLTLKKELEKRGHIVEIISPVNTPKLISFFLKAFGKVAGIFRSGYSRLFVSEFTYFVSIYFSVRKVRRKRNWNIIHGQDPSSSCAAKLAVHGKIKVVTTCHYNDNPVVERELAYKLKPKQVVRLTKWFRYLFSKTDNFIFVSDYIRVKSTHLLKEGSNIKIIHNGVIFFNKRNLSYDPSCFIITNVGTIEDRKNQLLLIKSASFLKKKGIHFKVWLLGDGPKKTEWQKLSIDEGLQEEIIFLGHKKNVIEIINQSHIYVHTSKNESSGLCILEAFSIGLPVLTLAAGGIPEHFPVSQIGLIDPAVDPEQLADKIADSLNYNTLKKLQSDQYEFASCNFTTDNMTNQTLAFYKSIISDHNQISKIIDAKIN